ncbi:MAG: PP2C family serine/threonine-protein phosphatase [Planctomycetia bacterium]|nr:PP2C family serine/threonine-protein phosphatase [Planctomycetia bacterium]
MNPSPQKNRFDTTSLNKNNINPKKSPPYVNDPLKEGKNIPSCDPRKTVRSNPGSVDFSKQTQNVPPISAPPKESRTDIAEEASLWLNVESSPLDNCYQMLESLRNLKLHNGKVGEPYSCDCNLFPNRHNLNKIVKLDILKEPFREYGISVSYEDGYLKFRGDPHKPFSGSLKISVEAGVLDAETTARFSGLQGGRKIEIYDKYDKIEVCGRFEGRFEAKDLFQIQFYIMPDPWTLWKELPPPQDAPYQKEDTASACMTFAGEAKSVWAASRRGRSHAQDAKFRDDHFAIKISEQSENAWNIFAVADGAGSARYSREGSKIACETVTRELSELLNSPEYSVQIDKEVGCITEQTAEQTAEQTPGEFGEMKIVSETMTRAFYTALYDAWTAIHKEAQKVNDRKIQDFHTTLLCAAVKKYPEFWAIASYWIGDGGLAVYQPNNNNGVLVLGKPDGGDYAGQTKFFTVTEEIKADPFRQRFCFYRLSDFRALFLMTDGITDPFFPAESKLPDVTCWNKFWNETLPKEFPGFFESTTLEEKESALLQGLNFKVAGNHDDRTLMILANPQDLKADKAGEVQ